jgi:general secretion pathway protein K
MNRQRGFALLIVLWTMGLLALLVAQFSAAGRTEVRVAANLRANAVMQAAADGAVHEAILQLLKGNWAPDGRAHVVRVGNAPVDVSVKDDYWKVNPNTATLPMLQALLVNRGIDAGRTATLSKAIIDWRFGDVVPPSGAARRGPLQAATVARRTASRIYESLDQLGLVPGMTPALLARIAPALSIYQESDALDTDATVPTGVASSQTGGAGWHFGSTGRVMLATIEAAAIGEKGGRFTRQAVVRLRAEASLDQAPYQILTWEVPAD